jgi:NAD(P)H-dependent FMN reductase
MIAVISGTNREGSRTLLVARLLADVYARQGTEVRLLDLRTLPAALFAPTSYGDEVPAFQEDFVGPILESRGLHIVVPEYNGSFPGVLKYMIDMLPWPAAFEDRPVAFTGLSKGRTGAMRPVEQLQMIYGHRNAYIYPRRVFIPSVTQVFGPEGTLLDEDLGKRLEAQAKGFAQFAQTLGSTRG